MNIMNKKITAGFTLIEVLVALVVFALGMLSIALHTTQSIKSKIDTQIHSTVMQIASQYMEPLNRALLISPEAFSSTLNNLGNRGTDPLFAEGNPSADNFQIQIASAVDRNNVNLINTAVPPSEWRAPFSVTLNITYTGERGETLTFPMTHLLAP